MRCGRLVVAILFLLLTPALVGAACDPDGADAATIAATRAAVAASCDCDGAANHGSYVRCARDVAKATLANPGCRGFVSRCAARSTCGRPGAVACCRTNAQGETRASIKGSAAACKAPQGGSACVSDLSSACEACSASGCAAPPTPTAAPTPSPTPSAAPTATPTPTLVPGVCGDGVLNLGEQCDGATCTATLNGEEVQSACGAPGTVHACECRSVQCGGCFDGNEAGVLCWQSDECLLQPGGPPMCITGSCVPTICDGPSDCTVEVTTCENGQCCVAGLQPPSFCRVFDQFELPCCGAAICGAGDLAVCCLPAGEGCSGNGDCCSGTCATGVCG